MIIVNNMILIGATGRNSGKTELATRLIKKFKKDHKVIGIKVTAIREKDGNCPRGGAGCGVCSSLEGNYSITEEKKLREDKDTGRMLLAGARKVYWLRILSECLEKGFIELLKKIDKDAVIICESNSLRTVVKPGLFIVTKQKHASKIKSTCEKVIDFADKIVTFSNDFKFDFNLEDIIYNNNTFYFKEKATVIILAGGKSKRMKKDKSLIQINGKPMIEHIYDQLYPYFDQVIISANEKAKFDFLNVDVVPDKIPDQGPLMGILSCLEKSDNKINFITACDIPEVNINFIKEMIRKSSNYDLVIPMTGKEKYEPLFAVFKKDIINQIDRIIKDGKRKISELFPKVKVKYINIPENNWYTNLNTFEDYKRYIKK